VGQVGSGDAPPQVPINPGSVIAQFPHPGARVDQDTAVNLTAAK